MTVKSIIAILVAGLFLVLSLSSLAIAVPVGGAGKEMNGPIDAAAKTTIRLIKVQYYDSGGKPHPVSLTDIGATYHVGGSKDVIIIATGYFEGPGGKGLVEIYDKNTGQNYASKLIPSGRQVSVITPAALFISTGTVQIGVLVEGPDGVAQKSTEFYIAP
ncbi:MAG: hypothetical protein LUO88_00465 [Methanoregulaceae archaeon]|nr:hypothetical protein [Methanoregulaceae archaeon]